MAEFLHEIVREREQTNQSDGWLPSYFRAPTNQHTLIHGNLYIETRWQGYLNPMVFEHMREWYESDNEQFLRNIFNDSPTHHIHRLCLDVTYTRPSVYTYYCLDCSVRVRHNIDGGFQRVTTM